MRFAVKSVVITMILAFSSSAFALDAASTISEDAQKILRQMEEEFGLENISSSTKKAISDQFSFALDDEWYSWWIGNEDLSSSKFKNEKVRVYDLIVVNNNRVNNITFTYFPGAQQIFFIRKQYVEGSSSIILDLYNNYKKEEGTKVNNETNNYAFTQREGYVDFDIFHVKGDEGMAGYVDAGVIDIE